MSSVQVCPNDNKTSFEDANVREINRETIKTFRLVKRGYDSKD